MISTNCYKSIAESNNFIVLEKYTKDWQATDYYQTEEQLEREFIQDLVNQGYEYLDDINHPETLLANVRIQLQALNDVQFSEGEWLRFVETYLDTPSDSVLVKQK